MKNRVVNRFRFTGQQLDPISQQYYLRAKYYNPVYYVDPSGNSCDNGADRICNLTNEGRIRGNNRSGLENYLKEKAGNMTDAESRIVKKLGLEVETGGKSGGKSVVVRQLMI